MEMNVNASKQQTSVAAPAPIKKQSSLWIAIKLCYKYIKFSKKAFWIAFLSSTISTICNVLVIIGVGYLSTVLLNYISSEVAWVTLISFSILVLVGFFLNAFTNFIMNFFMTYVAQKIGYYLRMDLFNKLQMLKLQYYDTHESGDIMSVLINDVFNLVLFISQNFGQLMFGFTTLFGMIILMFFISPYMALIVIACLPILLLYIWFLSKKSIPAFYRQQKELGRMNGYIEEIISGQNVVNLFSQEKNTEAQFERINANLNKEAEKAQSMSGIMIPWMNFINTFLIIVVIVIGMVFITTKTPFGSDLFQKIDYSQPNDVVLEKGIALITSFMLASRNLTQTVNNIIGMIASLQAALAGSVRTNEMFYLPNEDLPTETHEVDKLEGKVEIKNLNFGYSDSKLVLKDINLTAEPGQTIAIVGPTGSGKTTIINLLTKFYDIKDGDILLDGHSIKTMVKSSLRKQVSVVLQDTYLFSDTVKENLRYAKKDATDEEIINVAKIANCHNFIMQLENGYETQLTENASELSQGQKQLIAIARAMLSPSSILILDEATSNIDTRTEIVVQDAMLKLIKNKTSFVIAHRLSTIRNADKIVVLKNGEIIEMGNHQQLISKKGFYYQLSNSKSDKIDQED